MDSDLIEAMKVLENELVELCEGVDKETYDIMKRTFRSWSMAIDSLMEDSYLGKGKQDGQ
jgi:hypothetical protein